MERELSLREKLSNQLGDAPWRNLREHAARDGLVCCRLGEDILEAAVAIAEDNTAWVSQAIESGLLYKPSAEQLAFLEKKQETLFRFLIVQPFVVVQELGD